MIRDARKSRRAAKRLRAIVVERQNLVAELLAGVLETQHGIRVVATTGDVCAAADLLARHRADAMLLDLCIDGGGAFELLARVDSARIGVGVVGLDDRFHVGRLRDALRLGVAAYHTRHDSLAVVAGAIRLAAAGQTSFCREAAKCITCTADGPRVAAARCTPLETLSPRERDVFLSIAQGATVNECARRMKLAASTVDNHKTRLMHKLNVHRAIDLARLAIREGLIPS